jgi:hypothetical protein
LYAPESESNLNLKRIILPGVGFSACDHYHRIGKHKVLFLYEYASEYSMQTVFGRTGHISYIQVRELLSASSSLGCQLDPGYFVQLGVHAVQSV